jgi:DNA-binding IclR family transcriptional regulator
MSEIANSGTIHTVRRISTILRCFTNTNADLGVMQISKETGLHKSTASRLLSALHKEGFVEKNTETGKYRLGLGLVNLAGTILERQDLRQIAQEHIRALAKITQETINISILDGDTCINIETIRSPKSIRYAGQLGRRTPLHPTSTGKVLLTYMRPEQRQEILAQPLTAYTQHTIIDPVRLRMALAEVCDQGYAISCEEFEEGLVAIAAPIFDRSGEAIAALSISGPTYRMESDTLDKFANHLTETTQKISRLLGHTQSSIAKR